MKLKFIIQSLLVLVLFSCSTDLPDGPGGPGGAGFDLIEPCLDPQNDITLPAPLEDQSQYTMFEQTLLIATVVNLSESLRTSLPFAFYPPNQTTAATVDGVTVTATDKAVEWTLDGEKWVYLLAEDGYSIYFYPDGNISGREIVEVEQNEVCSSFRYVQYEMEGDANGVRDVTAVFSFDKAGTASLYSFGVGLEDEGGEEYDLRVFDDMSGDLWLKENGEAVQSIIWNVDGSGSYSIIENNEEVDSGTWTF